MNVTKKLLTLMSITSLLSIASFKELPNYAGVTDEVNTSLIFAGKFQPSEEAVGHSWNGVQNYKLGAYVLKLGEREEIIRDMHYPLGVNEDGSKKVGIRLLPVTDKSYEKTADNRYKKSSFRRIKFSGLDYGNRVIEDYKKNVTYYSPPKMFHAVANHVHSN